MKYSRGAETARIMMKSALTNTVEELYPSFLSAAAAWGVKDKTPDTDKQYFRAITKRLNASIPIAGLSKSDLDEMIIAMREIDPQLHTNVENLSKYHAPPESLPVNTNKCPWGISNKRPLVSSVFKTNDA